jgi:two-component system phosphate regulon sensor histidine kinase PhoR
MTRVYSFYLPIIMTSATCAIGSGLAVYFRLQNVEAALYALTGCLVCGGMICGFLRRHLVLEQQRLRSPEFVKGNRRSSPWSPFQSLVDEFQNLADELHTELQSKTQICSGLEVRSQIRLKTAQRLEHALECVGHPVVITDTNGSVHFHNQEFWDLYQSVSDNDSKDINIEKMQPLSVLLQETSTRFAATNTRQTEFDHACDGQQIRYRATSSSFVQDGSLQAIATVIRDIRDQRKQQSRHAEFVSAVCHELKTPMASIRAYIELLLDEDVTEPEEQRELFAFIETQVDRLTRLVNNMLNLTRIESGVIEIQRVDCELNDVINKAMDVLQAPADEKQITCHRDLSGLFMPTHIDRDLFGQALINLLSNAVKYTPAEGSIQVKSRVDEQQALIDIHDSGMGIPSESLPQIFDRFYRVPQNNAVAPGTGLGLSLVHYIVTELHNGTIEVESEVGQGTRFRITVPLGHQNARIRKHKEYTAID